MRKEESSVAQREREKTGGGQSIKTTLEFNGPLKPPGLHLVEHFGHIFFSVVFWKTPAHPAEFQHLGTTTVVQMLIHTYSAMVSLMESFFLTVEILFITRNLRSFFVFSLQEFVFCEDVGYKKNLGGKNIRIILF